MTGNLRTGSPLCVPRLFARAAVHDSGADRAGARHRRHLRHLQRRPRRHAQAAALSRPGPHRLDLRNQPQSGAGHRRRGELRRVARAEPLVRIPRHGRAEPPDHSAERPAARGHAAGPRPPTCSRRSASQAAHGRTFTQDEDLQGNDAVILLSHEFWQSRLGGRSDVVGSTIDADGRKRTVVGIMPPQFTIEGERADFYITYGWTTERLRGAIGPRALACHRPAARRRHAEAGRRRDGRRSPPQREKEAPRLNTGTFGDRPADSHAHHRNDQAGADRALRRGRARPAHRLRQRREPAARAQHGSPARARAANRARRRSRPAAAADADREPDAVAGRRCRSASRWRSSFIAACWRSSPIAFRCRGSIRSRSTCLWSAFTSVTALATGLLFGLIPALLASAMANDALREGGRHGAGPRSRRMLGALVVVEVALSLVLLTGAGLLIRSFVRLQNVDPGFRAEGVLTARVSLPGARYPQPRDSAAFFDDRRQPHSRAAGRAERRGHRVPADGRRGIGTQLLPARSARASRRPGAVDAGASGHAGILPDHGHSAARRPRLHRRRSRRRTRRRDRQRRRGAAAVSGRGSARQAAAGQRARAERSAGRDRRRRRATSRLASLDTRNAAPPSTCRTRSSRSG